MVAAFCASRSRSSRDSVTTAPRSSEPLVEIARHAEVDQEHGAVTPLADDRLELLGAEDRTRRGERAYNYVCDFQIRLEAVERDGGATEVTRERDGVVEGAARDKQRLDAEALQVARREFGHFSRAHQHHGLVGQTVENFAGETHRRGADGDRAVADERGLAHALGDRERLVECTMEHQSGAAGLDRLRVCDFKLAEDLRLADYHRVETCADPEEMTGCLAAGKIVERRCKCFGCDAAIGGEEAGCLGGGARVISGDSNDLDAVTG